VQIMNAITQLNPGLIIMGAGGMGKKGLLSGSVARRIIDHAKIPIIAVPDLEAAPSISRVVYMTNFNEADSDVILNIDAILSHFHVNIFCLHLLKDDNKDDAKQKIDNLSKNQFLKKLEGRISFHILDTKNQQVTLREFMEEYKIDLIAFIPHKRNILKNIFYQGITREDLFLTRIPIMAIKPIR